MKVRFLQTTVSAQPAYPFQAGQIVVFPKMTAEIRQWLKDERIEIIKDEPETAVDDKREVAVLGKGKR